MGSHVGVYFYFCKGAFKAMKLTTLRVFTEKKRKLRDLQVGDSFSSIAGKTAFFGKVIRQNPEKLITSVYLEAFGSVIDYPDEIMVLVEPYQMRINTVRKK